MMIFRLTLALVAISLEMARANIPTSKPLAMLAKLCVGALIGFSVGSGDTQLGLLAMAILFLEYVISTDARVVYGFKVDRVRRDGTFSEDESE